MSWPNRSSQRKANAATRRGRAACAAFTCWVLLLNAAQAASAVACKPLLSMGAVMTDRESPILPYEWKLAVFADARHCATRSGMFEIDFVRIQEYSPDLQFTERFQWSEGRFEVSFELSADEAVLEYRIGFVAPCVCSDIPFDRPR
jgi:hypothetical protein